MFAPLLLFSLFVFGGGLFAQVGLRIGNNFMTSGMYILAAPVAAFMVVQARDPHRMVRAFTAMLCIGALVVLVQLIALFGVRAVQHEKQFLVIPLALLFMFAPQRRPWHWAVLGLALVMAVLFRKNTAYLIALLTMAYLVVFDTLPQWRPLAAIRRAARLYGLLLAVLLVAAGVAFLLSNRDKYLPTGNTDYRLFTYERTFQRFLQSPLWGTGFAGPATEKFSLFDTGSAHNMLPTHSDLIDIVANGGLIGLGLWAWSLLRVARLAWANALQTRWRSHPLARYAHAMAGISLAGVLTYCFNPILLQPAKSLLMWTCLGMLAGIALVMRRDAAVSAASGGKP